MGFRFLIHKLEHRNEGNMIMADEDFEQRIELLRRDFNRINGTPFRHFFCPILHVDEQTPMCRGHIIPDSTETADDWIPQRKDIDNFYGAIVEGDFSAVVKDRTKTLPEIILSPKHSQQFRPQIMLDGKAVEYFVPKSPSSFSGHTPVQITKGDNDELVGNIVVKLSPDEMMQLVDKKLNWVVERDFRPAVTASVLKAAHLILFRLLGYDHVFSPSGLFLSQILRDFYLANRQRRKRDLAVSVESYFSQFESMIVPLDPRSAPVKGTLADNVALACIGASGKIFSLAVFVRASTDVFCVFLPNDNECAVGTYFSFLSDRPRSFAAKFVRFVPGTDTQESHWETPKGEPIRISFPAN